MSEIAGREIIRIQGHPAEVISGGFAVSIPTLDVFVNDAGNGYDHERYNAREKLAMRTRVINRARKLARAAVRARGRR